MAIRLLTFVIAVCWSVSALELGALGPNSLGQKSDVAKLSPRLQFVWAASTGELIAGAGAPDADPVELLANSTQARTELGLTALQRQNVHLVAIHDQQKLKAFSHQLESETLAQMRKEIDKERHKVELMIWRELTPKQIIRLQQKLLQLEGPCMAILDRQIARFQGIRPDQGAYLGATSERRSDEVRHAVKAMAPGKNSCAIIAESRSRLGEIRLREGDPI